MSKNNIKYKQDSSYSYSEVVNDTKELLRNKFLRKKSKNKDKKKSKNYSWD